MITRKFEKGTTTIQLLLAFLLLSVYSCSPKTSGQLTEANKDKFTTPSPDKNITVRFSLSDDKRAFYAISHHDTLVLQPSKLGVVMEDADFSKDLQLESVSEVEQVQDSYHIAHGKRLDNTYKANQRVYHLKNGAGKKMDVIFRVSDDGVAFRYFFPEQSQETKKISQELTSFAFAPTAKAWLQPMSDAKTGWSETNPSYEEHYQMEIPVGTPSPIKAGWVYPALFRSGNTWLLITESAPNGDYCGTRLHHQSPGGEYSIAFPQPQETMNNGPLYPQSATPWSSPWRIIAVGSLKTIVESTLGTDLAAPAVKMDDSFIKPGKASWSWALLKDNSITYDIQKRFIDYAADMHWNYCLVDVNWDTRIGYDRIKELADYGKAKNVGLILWYNSSGPWNSTEYTPKSKLLTHEARMQEFKKISELGVKGVKVDFFGGDGQAVMQYYIAIMKDAAANKLLVNFHGSTLPRGWHRTYPNLMTMEAIKGFEFITFEQANADVAPAHCVMLPFTRNAFDPMDFTPVNLDNIPNIRRRTSKGFELALAVLYLSGIQHFADTPEGMARVPGYVKDFMREVPVAWDDSKFVAGYPGKLAVIARQAKGKWYVAGINGENETKNLQLDLSFLANKQGTLITDNEQRDSFKNQTLTLPADGKVSVSLQPNGGFVMVF